MKKPAPFQIPVSPCDHCGKEAALVLVLKATGKIGQLEWQEWCEPCCREHKAKVIPCRFAKDATDVRQGRR